MLHKVIFIEWFMSMSRSVSKTPHIWLSKKNIRQYPAFKFYGCWKKALISPTQQIGTQQVGRLTVLFCRLTVE